MKFFFTAFLFLIVGISINAQPVNDLHNTAKKLMKE
jgi:hypothetical protein